MLPRTPFPLGNPLNISEFFFDSWNFAVPMNITRIFLVLWYSWKIDSVGDQNEHIMVSGCYCSLCMPAFF